MRAFVYVDGFNLYYRALKGTPFRWLDLVALSEDLLGPNYQLEKLRYFTAPVSGKLDQGTYIRQQTYLNALQSLPKVTVHYGSFLASIKVRPLEHALPDGTTHVRVLNMEEKGSDVNLATYLIHDAWSDVYDAALVFSQDTDLLEPLRITKAELRKRIEVVVLDGKQPGKLARSASYQHHLRPSRLAAAQFPAEVPFGRRGKVARKPNTW